MAIELTDGNFQENVIEKGGLSIIDFWAVWCGPCRMIAPIIDELSNEYGEQVTIGKVDVDNNRDISMKYGIRSIPTILFIKDGEVVDKQVGATSKANLVEKLEQHLN